MKVANVLLIFITAVNFFMQISIDKIDNFGQIASLDDSKRSSKSNLPLRSSKQGHIAMMGQSRIRAFCHNPRFQKVHSGKQTFRFQEVHFNYWTSRLQELHHQQITTILSVKKTYRIGEVRLPI